MMCVVGNCDVGKGIGLIGERSEGREISLTKQLIVASLQASSGTWFKTHMILPEI